MPLPPHLDVRYTRRFDELIKEGEALLLTVKTIGGARRLEWGADVGPRRHIVDFAQFVEWRIKCSSLLGQIIQAGSTHHSEVVGLVDLECSEDHAKYLLSLLRGIKADYEGGFLGDLALEIEAELAADYMGQAEMLLEEGKTEPCGHVPAAVLAGAVLEKALRTMCSQQEPPIAAVDDKGRALMLSSLTETLRKAGAYKETVAMQLRAWTKIRNHAAHGEFSEFTRGDVDLMVRSIKGFLAKYVK